MNRLPITAQCYAGARSDESPRRLTIAGTVHIVSRVLAESLEASFESNQQSRRYRVLTREGRVLEIVRDCDGRWYLESHHPAGHES